MKNYDDMWFWWYDEMMRLNLIYFFTPNFVMGNLDEWIKLGVTLNGARPICKP